MLCHLRLCFLSYASIQGVGKSGREVDALTSHTAGRCLRGFRSKVVLNWAHTRLEHSEQDRRALSIFIALKVLTKPRLPAK